jgi:peptidoglycan/LPS O-acetylase OafA/YrhL
LASTPASPPACAPPPPSPALAPPPGNPRFPLFDGLRGLLVLAILAFHSSELTGRIGFGVSGRFCEVAGSVAVLGFFAVSGFLLYRPYSAAWADGRDPPSLRRYLRRRSLRILPAYWTALTLLAIYPGIAGVFTHDWWRYYGYLQVYSQRTQNLGIPVAWTLCVEVSFYLALPLWAHAVRRLNRGELLPLAVLALAGLAVQCAAGAHVVSYPVGVSLPGECTWMAIGMALAVISVRRQREPRSFAGLAALAERSELCWAISAACFLVLMLLVPHGGLFGLIYATESHQPVLVTLRRAILEIVLVALLLMPPALAVRRGAPGALLASAPLTQLGVISYSFYLWHLTILELIQGTGSGTAFSAPAWNLLGGLHFARALVLFLTGLLVTALVATVSYRAIELPFLRAKEPARGARA